MSPLVEAWLRSHLWTQAIEVSGTVLLLRGRGIPVWRRAAASGVGTLLTHPILWFVWPRIWGGYWSGITIGELAIIGVEAGVMRAALPISGREALSTSALVNGGSYLLGVLLGA
jgi:hypothetical protein